MVSAAEIVAAARGQSMTEYRDECGGNRARWESQVEAIVARHVAEARAAALNEAADALEDHAEKYGDPADNGHIYADLVRNLAAEHPPQ